MRAGALLVLGALAYLLASLGAHGLAVRVEEPPRTAVLDTKLRYLSETAVRYDMVFVGASRVYRHLDAKAFDERMAERGCPVRSFNMGVPGLSILEQDRVLRTMAQAGRVPWIILESLPAMPGPFGNLDSPRLRHALRTLEDLMRALRDQWQAPKHLHQRVATSAELAIAWAYGKLAFGQLNRALFPPDESGDQGFVENIGDGGYVPLEAETHPRFAARRDHSTDAQMQARVDALPYDRDDDIQPGQLGTDRRAHLRSQADLALAAAERVGFVLQPFIDPLEVADNRALAALAPEIVHAAFIVNMNDPGRYAEIFKADRWFDGGHLTRTAAARVSAALADRLCPIIGANAREDQISEG